MTLEELINKLNRVNPAFIYTHYDKEINQIDISNRVGDLIMSLSADELDSNDFDVYHDSLKYGPYTIYRVLNSIMEYINTPIEERDIPKRNIYIYVIMDGHILLTKPDSDCIYITWLDLNSIDDQSNKNIMQCIDDNGCSIPSYVWDSIKNNWDKCTIDEFYNKEDVID